MNYASSLSQFGFTDPARLLVLAALPLFLFLTLRGKAVTSATMATALLRAAIVGLLVMALAGPVQLLPGVARHVVLVADRSTSAAASQALVDNYLNELAGASGMSASLVTFGSASPSGNESKLADARTIAPAASNPAEAALLADALLPDGGQTEILLLTDARQTSGDLAKAAQGVRAPITVVPLAPFAQPEVSVERVRVLDDAPSASAPTRLEVTVVANHAGQGELLFSHREKVVANQPVSLTEGTQQVVVPLAIDRRALAVVSAEISAAEDTFAENNRRRVIVPPRPPLRVLIVDRQPATIQKLVTAIEASEVQVQTSPQLLPPDELATYDVLVLSDMPAAALGEAGTAAVDAYVRAGGGMIVVGDDDVYGVDALSGTSLEAILPVKASPRIAERKPTLAMVLVIDKSKSMLDDNRLELAKRAAGQTVDELEAEDQVGVLAFGTDNEWVTEIVPVGDKTELKRRIATLQAAGQTDMYPALEKAYLALEQADADRRHAIVLTDGVSTPGDFDEIARRMAAEGITVSTVSISPGAEQQILKDIARIAGGQHYHCDDAADIVSILVRDTRRVGTKAVEFPPIIHQPLPGLDTRGAPPLLGYAPTSPHGGAQLLLRTEGGDPLLAWRRHGRGTVIAFTADVKDRFAARWLAWPGFAGFWSRLANYARRQTWNDFRVSTIRRGDRATIALDLLDAPAEMKPPLVKFGRLGDDDRPPSDSPIVPLTRTAPNHYEANVDVSLGGTYVAAVEFVDADGQSRRQIAGLAYDYDDEFQLGPADEELLRNVARQTGGRFAPAPRDVAVGRIEPRGTPTALWPYFVLAAAVLLVCEVLVRRLPQMLGQG